MKEIGKVVKARTKKMKTSYIDYELRLKKYENSIFLRD